MMAADSESSRVDSTNDLGICMAADSMEMRFSAILLDKGFVERVLQSLGASCDGIGFPKRWKIGYSDGDPFLCEV